MKTEARLERQRNSRLSDFNHLVKLNYKAEEGA